MFTPPQLYSLCIIRWATVLNVERSFAQKTKALSSFDSKLSLHDHSAMPAFLFPLAAWLLSISALWPLRTMSTQQQRAGIAWQIVKNSFQSKALDRDGPSMAEPSEKCSDAVHSLAVTV